MSAFISIDLHQDTVDESIRVKSVSRLGGGVASRGSGLLNYLTSLMQAGEFTSCI